MSLNRIPTDPSVTSDNMPLFKPTASPNLVLLIDDDPCVRRALVRILRMGISKDITMKGELDIRQAESGNEGIAGLQEGLNPKLIVSDVSMPDGTGMDVWEFIEKHAPQFRDRILFVTGGGATKELQQFISTQSGKERVLTKPIDTTVMLDRANEIMSSK